MEGGFEDQRFSSFFFLACSPSVLASYLYLSVNVNLTCSPCILSLPLLC